MEPPATVSFAALLRRFRLAAGMTQGELAEHAHVSSRSISDLERGVSMAPRLATVRFLADALQLSSSDRAALLAAARDTGKTSLQSRIRTFLICDVRGYTRYSQQHGDEAAARLALRFAEICEQVVAAHEGRVLELRGDEALCEFLSARNALRAVLELQAAFRDARKQNPDLPLKVGVGLDAGEAIAVKGGYRGGSLNLAARLCALAGPDEVFCSDTVINLTNRMEGITFAHRGAVTLKGFENPVRVIQIGAEGEIPPSLPPLQPALVSNPSNLPDERTPFIARDKELTEVSALVQQPAVRLVTLTGPGGTGKTRLALHLGASLLPEYPDGVFFAALDSLADPSLVPAAIAAVLGIKEEKGLPPLEALMAHLADKRLLLVLDNFEHLLEAAPSVASLLDGCRSLTVLVTSRFPLHLTREHEYAVPPLPVPDPLHLPTLEVLSQYAAVALFIERARAVKADFSVTNQNAPAVAAICAHLDGLPLAIELAAARVRVFPPETLLQRLQSRLSLLVGGPRDVPARQQTLRATIDWSYTMLAPDEQRLFNRVSVFAGGFSMEAAELVCNPDGDLDILDGLLSLVEKNLVQQVGHQDERFDLLETIREYASQKLDQSQERELIHDAHFRYYLDLAEHIGQDSTVGERASWLDRLDMEHDNVRAAQDWALAQDGTEGAKRLAVALVGFWVSRGYMTEGRARLSAVLGRDDARDALHARLLCHSGGMAEEMGDLHDAKALFSSSLDLCRELENAEGVQRAIYALGFLAQASGEYAEAQVYAEQSLAMARAEGNERRIAWGLHTLALIALDQRELERGAEIIEEELDLWRRLGKPPLMADAINLLAIIATEREQYARAAELFENSLAMARTLRDATELKVPLIWSGIVAQCQGRFEDARMFYAEALEVSEKMDSKIGTSFAHACWASLECAEGDYESARRRFRVAAEQMRRMGDAYPDLTDVLEGLAELETALGEWTRAAHLLGAAEALRSTLGIRMSPRTRTRRRNVEERVLQDLDHAEWEGAVEVGRGTPLSEILDSVLEARKG